MALNAFLSNQGTQTSLLTDNTGGTAGTLIPVMKLDVSSQGTAGTIWTGNVGLNGGTTPLTSDVTASGTLTGTQNLPINANGLTSLGVQVINTFTGTLIGEASLDGGNTWNPTTFVTLANGSIITSINGPTFAQVNLAGLGSYRVRANTISAGSAMVYLRGNQGAANVMMDNSLPVGANTIGNIGSLLAGTINTGTINAGTFRQDARTTQNILTYGTQISGTAAIAATIIGSTSVGAGTSLWLQDVSVTNNNANVLCVLGFGTAQQGTNVLLRHTLGTSGAVGIEKTFGKVVNAGMTNQDLVFSLGAAGTVDLTFSYLISA